MSYDCPDAAQDLTGALVDAGVPMIANANDDGSHSESHLIGEVSLLAERCIALYPLVKAVLAEYGRDGDALAALGEAIDAVDGAAEELAEEEGDAAQVFDVRKERLWCAPMGRLVRVLEVAIGAEAANRAVDERPTLAVIAAEGELALLADRDDQGIPMPDDEATLIDVTVRHVFGRLTIYPENRRAHVLAQLAGTKTLTAKDLVNAERLGLHVNCASSDYRRWLADAMAAVRRIEGRA